MEPEDIDRVNTVTRQQVASVELLEVNVSEKLFTGKLLDAAGVTVSST